MSPSVANTRPSEAALAVVELIWREKSSFAPVAAFNEAEALGLIERQRAIDRNGQISDFYKVTDAGRIAMGEVLP